MKKALKHSSLHRVLLILLIFALPLSGCVGTPKAKFEKGFDYPNEVFNGTKIGVTSTNNKFDVNAVELNVHYGFHEGESDSEKRMQRYRIVGYETAELVFGLFAGNGPYDNINFTFGDVLNDYKVIENCFFIKGISQEEAVKDEYALKFSSWWLNKTSYNHSETITIPDAVFSQQQGEFCIIIIGFLIDAENSNYCISSCCYEQFSYTKSDDDTIEIIF